MRVLVDTWASMIHAYLVFVCSTSLLVLASNYAGHRGFQRHLQLFTRVFHGVIELHIVRIDVIDVSQLPSIVDLRHFYSPMPFFFLLRGFLTSLTRPLAIGNRAWRLLELLSIAPPRTTCIHLEGFRSIL